MTDRRADFVQSLERGLAVIRAFDGEHPSLSLSEVSRRSGLTRATARRFLLTLVELGYVHHDGREFTLRPSVLDLGFAYLSSMGLPEVALPHMEALVAALQESSSMSVLDGGDVIYVARVPTRRRIMAVSIAVGTRFPAHATSMGRVLLAHLGPADLDAYFTSTPLTRLTASTVHDEATLRRVLGGVPSAATRSSTRSSRRASARRRHRSAARTATSWPPSTCPCTPAGRRSPTSRSASCHRCSTPSPGSMPTSAR